MPRGMIVFAFDARVGTEIKTKFPADLDITSDILMRIYSTHSFEESGGFLSMIIGSLNVASYFTGPETNHYVSLILSMDEDPDTFEDALTDAAREIMANLQNDRYLDLVPSIYNRIKLYPTFEEEQKIAVAYADMTKRIILDRLIEDGSATKTDLLTWIREKTGLEFIDIDAILNSLVKLGLVKISSVKGLPSESVFLTSDVFITRAPAVAIIKKSQAEEIKNPMARDYLASVKSYFKNYTPTPEDEKLISNIMADTDTYKILNLLRLSIVNRKGLDKLSKQIEDMDGALKKIWSAGLIQVLKDKQGEEFYYLKTDIRIEKFYPEYLVNKIRQAYEQKTISNPVLKEHLKHLRDQFIDLKGLEKLRKKEKGDEKD
ncbi:MAG: hypothetical protein EAX96_02960 [Candidatus Lokiarchaeota archaeon]|nr:hypothetical protein [Candidatus Lokiarchaeota archaeon]